MVGPSSFSLEWRTLLSLSRPLPLPPSHLGAYPPPADLRPQHAYAVRTRSPSGCIAAVGDRLSHQRGSGEVRAGTPIDSLALLRPLATVRQRTKSIRNSRSSSIRQLSHSSYFSTLCSLLAVVRSLDALLSPRSSSFTIPQRKERSFLCRVLVT